MRKKSTRGAALIEAALMLVTYLLLTLGGMEYLWYLHIRQSLTAASDAAVWVVAANHKEPAPPKLGVSSLSLNPYRPGAEAAARNLLLEMGFSNDFVSSVDVTIEYVSQLKQENSRLQAAGFPQDTGLRLVGAVVSVPWERAMIFGDFASTVLHLVQTPPSQLSVTTLMWKKWKQAS